MDSDLIRRLVDLMADAVIVISQSGEIIFWNDAAEKIYGWTANEANGNKLIEVFPQHPSSVADQSPPYLYTEGQWRGEITRIKKDGDAIVVDCQRIVHQTTANAITDVIEISRDTSSQRIQEIVLRDTARTLQAVMDNTSSYIHVRDINGRFLYVNTQYRKVFGLGDYPVTGKLIEDIFHGNIAVIRRQMHETVLHNQVDLHAEVVQEVDGVLRTYMDVKSPLFDEDGTLYAVYCIGTDITERKILEASMEQLAHFDQVTRLPNRVLFQDRLGQAIKKSLRTGEIFALLFLDLDAFKDVNDTFGHATGDQLLTAVGLRLRTTMRSCDTVARLGGDEFTIILEGLQNFTDIEPLTQKILAAFRRPFEINGRDISVSASIGITVSPSDAQDSINLMKNADHAMYAAKHAGPGRYRFYKESMNVEAATRLRIIADLKLAIRDSQFRLFYQPIVSLKDGSFHKAEALIRWEHPERGNINPVDFIPTAEQNGDIVAIGDWVFCEATRQCAVWRSLFDDKFQISINTSPMQYRNNGLDIDSWKKKLSAEGLPANAIAIEITEGLLMDASDSVRDQLQACSDLGMDISLDDFGTGYSSLSYLMKFDVDYLKIDRTFVKNISENANDFVLCEAIVAMAHKLGLLVIAEGVETNVQRELLISAGCDFGQGYYFSEPMPPELFEQKLIQGL